MVDWCAVYQGVVDMGDYTFDHPVFKMVEITIRPNEQDASAFDVVVPIFIYASRRMFNQGKYVVTRYIRSTVSAQNMPNNALRAGWAAIAAEYKITQASFNYFPLSATVPVPV